MRCRGIWQAVGCIASIILFLWETTASAQTAKQRIDEALQNVSNLMRAERVGYATIFDGNKYVQCRRMPSREFRCEAAGITLQPSLQSVLTPERIGKLIGKGWVLDPSFGNFVQSFPAEKPTAEIAEHLLTTLTEGYDANPATLDLITAWVADIPCPPRNGRSQNLAGSVNDSTAMRSMAIRSCSYTPDSQRPQIAKSLNELLAIYGATVTAEIQRLRINAARRVFAIFDAGIGYLQCAPDAVAREIYCEAQSAESWEALAAVLTPDRVSYLQKAGYADPGRVPNYSKTYPFAQFSDAAIASEILTILFEVYGYQGATKLKTTGN